jgi:xanthine/CO dehydrogenase XdhC/CoxF family maturation factor
MREIVAIVNAYDEAKAQGIPCVLATVVHVEGSSYRRAGARMLVDENGMMTGAISGGCLEGDALIKALHALHQDRNKLVSYDTSDENDAIIGAQLGCNGIIQVLFEPIHFDQPQNPLELLRKATESTEPMVIVTRFNLKKNNPQPGTTLLLDHNLNASGNLNESRFSDQIMADARLALNEDVSLFREYFSGSEKQHVFLELFSSPTTLVLVGAGNDAQVLSHMAGLLGWKIIITDGRPSHANTTRFENSCQVIVSEPEAVLKNVQINERTVFVLMTHNYQYDLAVLKLLLPIQEVPYIGILGPKSKYQRMLDELAENGIHPTELELSRIYAPVGLDLGSETSVEIALSILAEIQAVITSSPATSLRLSAGPIHKKLNTQFKTVTV